jgi:hypothetical protein
MILYILHAFVEKILRKMCGPIQQKDVIAAFILSTKISWIILKL